MDRICRNVRDAVRSSVFTRFGRKFIRFLESATSIKIFEVCCGIQALD